MISEHRPQQAEFELLIALEQRALSAQCSCLQALYSAFMLGSKHGDRATLTKTDLEHTPEMYTNEGPKPGPDMVIELEQDVFETRKKLLEALAVAYYVGSEMRRNFEHKTKRGSGRR